MQKWEYKCISIMGDGEKTTRVMNELGREGWELVTAHAFIWHYFKRPLADDSKD